MGLAAIVAGAALLGWPAWLNGYPILFGDTNAFLAQTDIPAMVWDKPWIYGPFLLAFHWGVTLWGPLLAVLLGLSHLLWLTQRAARGVARAGWHVALCAGLAGLTSAPWVASLLMPDILAPALVLCLYLLAFAKLARWETALLTLVATLCAAAHLSHLPLAAALIGLTLLLGWRLAPVLRAALPLGLALALLVATNWVGNGIASVSPYGSVFALARLVGDGPAARVIDAACPAAGWHMCRWAGRLPTDSDLFLWEQEGPVWAAREDGAEPGGAISLAPEASEIVGRTLRAYPLEVARLAAGNAWTQLFTARVGDVLGRADLGDYLLERVRSVFGDAEAARLQAGLQWRDGLRSVADGVSSPHPWVAVLGALGTLLAWRRAHQAHDLPRLRLALFVLVGLTANAVATGALSKPHHRYQARIIWLLPLAAALCWRPPVPGPPVADYS
jgi:hypothetical protein